MALNYGILNTQPEQIQKQQGSVQPTQAPPLASPPVSNDMGMGDLFKGINAAMGGAFAGSKGGVDSTTNPNISPNIYDPQNVQQQLPVQQQAPQQNQLQQQNPNTPNINKQAAILQQSFSPESQLANTQGLLTNIFGSNPVQQANDAISSTFKNADPKQITQSLIPSLMPQALEQAGSNPAANQLQSVGMSPNGPQNAANIRNQVNPLVPVQQPNILGALKQNNPNQFPNQLNPNIQQAQKQQQQQEPIVNNTMSSIAEIESGGEKNPYSLVTPAGNGESSLGKYQFKSKYLPGFTKQYLGKAMTKEEFLNNPQAQEQLMKARTQDLLDKGHSPNDIASIHFTGHSLNKAGRNVHDSLGTTNGQYQDKFTKLYNQKVSINNTEDIGAHNIESASRAAQQSNGDVMQIAKAYMGDGPKAHADVLQSFFKKSGVDVNPQTTPWCAGFANAVLKVSGRPGTGSLSAKSLLNYGTPTKNPQKGDIVVYNDMSGDNNPAKGHVGFVDSIVTKNGQQYVRTLGGNQDGQVKIKDYPISKVAGFRIPPTPQQLQHPNAIAMQGNL